MNQCKKETVKTQLHVDVSNQAGSWKNMKISSFTSKGEDRNRYK